MPVSGIQRHPGCTDTAVDVLKDTLQPGTVCFVALVRVLNNQRGAGSRRHASHQNATTAPAPAAPCRSAEPAPEQARTAPRAPGAVSGPRARSLRHRTWAAAHPSARTSSRGRPHAASVQPWPTRMKARNFPWTAAPAATYSPRTPREAASSTRMCAQQGFTYPWVSATRRQPQSRSRSSGAAPIRGRPRSHRSTEPDRPSSRRGDPGHPAVPCRGHCPQHWAGPLEMMLPRRQGHSKTPPRRTKR
jgi:hypothetical protein